MSLRTTYNAEDLQRAVSAPRRLHGLYEQMQSSGKYKPVFSNYLLAKDNVPKMEGQLDSGLGEELHDEEMDDGREPVKPKLILDSENQDSGLGRDAESDDDVKDSVLSKPSVRPPPVERPKKPKVNHFTKMIQQQSNFGKRSASEGQLQVHRKPAAVNRSKRSRTPSPPSSVPTHNMDTISFTNSYRQGAEFLELQKWLQYFLPNKDGDTGLHLAVIHSLMGLLEQLLMIASRDPRLRPVLDEQNGLFQTALHLATHTQQTDMIRKLLIAGASLHLTDHKGNTPLHVACKFSSPKCLDEILRYVSLSTLLNVSQIRNNDGLSCVHVAARYGNTDTLRKLKNMGVDMNMQHYQNGKTALHMAVEKGSLSEVHFVLETCKIDVNAMTYSGCTALHIAAGRGNIAIVAYLISMGADPELLTDEGDSALDLASSEQVITLLTKAAALKWL